MPTVKLVEENDPNPLVQQVFADIKATKNMTLSHWRGADVDSSALGADGSSLAQPLCTYDLPAPRGAGRRRANCPRLSTTLYTPFEKESSLSGLNCPRELNCP